MSLKILHFKMVFEILAISIFFHKYNPSLACQSKKQTQNIFSFFEMPTHMFPFLKYTPLWKKENGKSYSTSKNFSRHFISFEM